MRIICPLILTVSVLLSCMVSCVTERVGMERTDSFSEVRSQFRNPGKEFRPVPLWVWNTAVTRDDIDRMLSDFKRKGFGGAFVHPRPAMETEYLSREWFDLWRYSVERGKQLGLDIWIYDENSFPSGFAGGHVQHEMPESYDHQTGWTCMVSENKPDNTDEYDLCRECEGKWYLFKGTKTAPWRFVGNLPYVDLLYPGVTEKFIDITMTGYEKEFGKELGTTVKGVFQDEPAWQNWTPDLPDQFRKDWGYDLEDNLPSLFHEVGDWKKVRSNFNYTKIRLFNERWVRPWYNYCEKHNLLRTGHYGEHMWPTFELESMAAYAMTQMPGIDLLFNVFDINGSSQFGNVMIVKELSSAANQTGYTRTLSETYGGAGWDLTFEDFKRLGDWEYVLGVNFMCQHYSSITCEGVRKFDWPCVFTSTEPWFEDYGRLNDYFARLSVVLSQGEQVNDNLVLLPNSTLWQYFTRFGSTNGRLYEVARQFRTFLNELESSQVEYDLGSELLFDQLGAYVRNGKLTVGKRSYSTVIIPKGVENILNSTVPLLREFVEQGGKLIALATPTAVDGSENQEMISFWKDGRIEHYAECPLLSCDKIAFGNVSGGLLYHQRREYDEGQLLFIVNSSLDECSAGSVTMKGLAVTELNALNGEESPCDCTPSNGYVTVDFNIPPAGSLLLFASTKAKNQKSVLGTPSSINTNSSEEVLDPVSDMRIKRLSDNWFLLDYCDLWIDGKELQHNRYAPTASMDLYRYYGMDNPWQGTVQYKTDILDSDTIKCGDIKVRYNFCIAEDFDWSDLKLVCEKPRIWEVSVNGFPLKPIDGEHPLDSRNAAFAIGKYVHKGTNTVELHRYPMSIHAEVTYAYLTGNFSVSQNCIGWQMCAPHEMSLGSWHSQDMPFYCWGVSYSREYDIVDISKRHILRMGQWNGSVCEIYVNGVKEGIVAFKPFEFDMTPYLKRGRNSIDVVCVGSLSNLFGPHFSAHEGILPPGPESRVNEFHAAKDYLLQTFGLMEPYNVISLQ